MTTKQKKIRLLLEKLSAVESSLPRAGKNMVAIKYLEGINTKLAQFKEDFNLEPVNRAVDEISGEVSILQDSFKKKIEQLEVESRVKAKELTNAIKLVKKDFVPIAGAVGSLANKSKKERASSREETAVLRGLISTIENRLGEINNDLQWTQEFSSSLVKVSETKIVEDISARVDELRKYLLEKIANNSGHGGSANRQIFVDGSDPLTRYTDINLVAGSGISITTANNDTTRKATITFSAAGSGISVETPVGDVDGSNTTYTVSNTPLFIIADGMFRVSGEGYTYSAPTITMDALIPPTQFIRSFFAS